MMIHSVWRSAAILAATVVLHVQPVQAQVSVVTGSTSSNNKVINFDQFGPNWQYGPGPTQVGGTISENVVFTSSCVGSVLGGGGSSYGLGDNGGWRLKSSAGLNCDSGYMTFTFGPMVSFVGGFMNYAPGFGPSPFIEALSMSGSVLATYLLNITTPGGNNAGTFFGFQSMTADIAAFRLHNGYVIVDDVTFNRDLAGNGSVVPEPVTMLLLGTGLAGVAAARGRRGSVVV
jgi:hypothetical protein